jgi:hypothetical protein
MAEPSIRLRRSGRPPPAEGGLDQSGQGLERHLGRMVRQVILALAGGAMLTDKPSLLTRQVLGS